MYYQTCLDLKCSKVVKMANGPDFECHFNSGPVFKRLEQDGIHFEYQAYKCHHLVPLYSFPFMGSVEKRARNVRNKT